MLLDPKAPPKYHALRWELLRVFDSIHVLDRGKGHFLPANDPPLVVDATLAVVAAARTQTPLPACDAVFANSTSAGCLEPGALGRQQIRPEG